MIQESRITNAVVAAIAGALSAAVVAAAAPQPAAAPAGMRDHVVTLRELNVRLQAVEGDAYDWRRFERCIHRSHITIAGDVALVTWRRVPSCLTVRHG